MLFIMKGKNEEMIFFAKEKRLRLGYFKRIEFFQASLANQRAVEEAVHDCQ